MSKQNQKKLRDGSTEYRPPPGFRAATLLPPNAPVFVPSSVPIATTAVERSQSTSTEATSTTTGKDACSICYDHSLFFAVGLCNHHMCLRCTARLRVLCKDTTCPVCRRDLTEVVIQEHADRSFEKCNKSEMILDQEYNVYFQSSAAQQEFHRLFDLFCLVCFEKQPSDRELRIHTRKVHDKQYCELCYENTRLFPSERKLYTRKELVEHNSTTRKSEEMFPGHPKCVFCDMHYFDSEHLYRHMREKHELCTVCSALGNPHQYFAKYDTLKDHYEAEHIICTESQCIQQRHVVFANEIDYKKHMATQHLQHASRSEARATRRIDVEFKFEDREQSSRGRGRGSGGRNGSGRQRQQEEYVEEAVHQPQAPPSLTSTEFPDLSDRAPKPQIPAAYARLLATDNFPALSASTSNSSAPAVSHSKPKPVAVAPIVMNSADDFPALPVAAKPAKQSKQSQPSKPVHHQTPTTTTTTASKQVVKSHSAHSAPKLDSHKGNRTARIDDEEDDFSSNPTLSETRPVLAPPSVLLVPRPVEQPVVAPENKRASAPNINAHPEDYPSLPAAPKSQPQQQQHPKVKHPVPSVVKQPAGFAGVARARPNISVEQATAPPSTLPLESDSDFPTLSRTSSVEGSSSWGQSSTSLTLAFAVDPSVKYRPPAECASRAYSLMAKIKILLGDNLVTFQEASGQFQQDKIGAIEYVDTCIALFGGRIGEIFPDCIALLPNILKQHHLFAAYALRSDPVVKSVSISQNKIQRAVEPANIPSIKGSLEICQSCGQINLHQDVPKHRDEHELEDYPSLVPSAPRKQQQQSAKPTTAVKSAWAK